MRRAAFLFVHPGVCDPDGTERPQPDWSKLEDETMHHFQALLRFDTSDPPLNPPGGEKPAVDYLKQVLDKEGIPAQILALEPNRPNVVARLKGNGSKRPILLMGHTDVVNVDPKKWTHPPFSATRQDGYVYGRGTVDDKDNATAVLMVMLTLKRLNVPLDRDVIALCEAGEEGASRLGIQFMANEHFPLIDAEYCFAEGGSVQRENGQVKFASIQTVEKIPRAIRLTARGVAGHGSVPLETNSIVHLSDAVAKVGKWAPPDSIERDDRRVLQAAGEHLDARGSAALSRRAEPRSEGERRGRRVLPRQRAAACVDAADLGVAEHLPGRLPLNVIPSEAMATLDVRMLPDEDANAFLEQVKRIVNDPAIEVAFSGQASRPPGAYAAQHRSVRGARSQRHQTLQGDHAADDEHGRDGHGVSARQGHPVLRRRPSDRFRRRAEGLRRAQRSGADSRERALSLRPLPLRHRRGSRAEEVTAGESP